MYPTGVAEWRREVGGLDLSLDALVIGFSHPKLRMDPGVGEVDSDSGPMIEVELSRPPSASLIWRQQ